MLPACTDCPPTPVTPTMAPQFILDLTQIDLTHVIADAHQIESVNPHRGHMRLLDAIIWKDEASARALAIHHVRDDEFWVAGHIPGRPIFPGVLMIEAAAQLSSYLSLTRMPEIGFMGFAGVDKVKFRGQVKPGDDFYILLKEIEFRPRRCICAVQGVVDGNLVFEGQITGMPI